MADRREKPSQGSLCQW